jgi:hypothetical protein
LKRHTWFDVTGHLPRMESRRRYNPLEEAHVPTPGHAAPGEVGPGASAGECIKGGRASRRTPAHNRFAPAPGRRRRREETCGHTRKCACVVHGGLCAWRLEPSAWPPRPRPRPRAVGTLPARRARGQLRNCWRRCGVGVGVSVAVRQRRAALRCAARGVCCCGSAGPTRAGRCAHVVRAARGRADSGCGEGECAREYF